MEQFTDELVCNPNITEAAFKRLLKLFIFSDISALCELWGSLMMHYIWHWHWLQCRSDGNSLYVRVLKIL